MSQDELQTDHLRDVRFSVDGHQVHAFIEAPAGSSTGAAIPKDDYFWTVEISGHRVRGPIYLYPREGDRDRVTEELRAWAPMHPVMRARKS